MGKPASLGMAALLSCAADGRLNWHLIDKFNKLIGLFDFYIGYLLFLCILSLEKILIKY